MYTVGLDKIEGLILYSQLNVVKLEIINQDKTDDTFFNSVDTKEIIFGCLLGDGKLEMAPSGVNSRFGFTQSEYQKDYFISVCNSLSNICGGGSSLQGSRKYREYSYLDKRTGKTYKSINF